MSFRLFHCFLISLALAGTAAAAAPEEGTARPVRIRLVAHVSGAREVRITPEGAYRVLDLSTRQVLAEGTAGETWLVSGEGSEVRGTRVAPQSSEGAPTDEPVRATGLRIESVAPDGRLRVRAGREELLLPGALELTRGRRGLAAVNEAPLEQYLLGVVAAEGAASFHVEALKALAVAARSYTERNRGRHGECAAPTPLRGRGSADGLPPPPLRGSPSLTATTYPASQPRASTRAERDPETLGDVMGGRYARRSGRTWGKRRRVLPAGSPGCTRTRFAVTEANGTHASRGYPPARDPDSPWRRWSPSRRLPLWIVGEFRARDQRLRAVSRLIPDSRRSGDDGRTVAVDGLVDLVGTRGGTGPVEHTRAAQAALGQIGGEARLRQEPVHQSGERATVVRRKE
jgi:hypothetical protein